MKLLLTTILLVIPCSLAVAQAPEQPKKPETRWEKLKKKREAAKKKREAARKKAEAKKKDALAKELNKLPAKTAGGKLAKEIELEAERKPRKKLALQAAKLSVEQKRDFVKWAKAMRKARAKKNKPGWQNLAYALAKLNVAEASAELGEVARKPDRTDGSAGAGLARKAAEALTCTNPDLGVPELVKGLTSPNADVRDLHAEFLTLHLAEGTPRGVWSAPLRSFVSQVGRLEEEADNKEGAAVRVHNKAMELVSSLVAAALTRTDRLSEFLEAAGGSSPVFVAAGVARGAGERVAQRLAPVRKAVRRLRMMKVREAKARGDDPKDLELDDEELLDEVLMKDKKLTRLREIVANEVPTLTSALSVLVSTRDEAEILAPAITSAEALLDELDGEWADLLIPALEHDSLKVRNAAIKALRTLSGQDLAQSRKVWEKWWEEQ